MFLKFSKLLLLILFTARVKQISTEENISTHFTRTKITSLSTKWSIIFLPTDCQDVLDRGHKISGVYKIQPEASSKSFWVWCDLTTDGGGWTYILNRIDGSVDFNRTWTDYKDGFGDLTGELWLGLQSLYQLTSGKTNELLIELVDWDLQKVYAKYNQFIVGDESEHFNLKKVGNYSGNSGDSFSLHEENRFSTLDDDSVNCAKDFGAGWWYSNCFYSLLTGKYVSIEYDSPNYHDGIEWSSFHGFNYSLKQARMMIRPIS